MLLWRLSPIYKGKWNLYVADPIEVPTSKLNVTQSSIQIHRHYLMMRSSILVQLAIALSIGHIAIAMPLLGRYKAMSR